MREIDEIIIHCTATPAGRDVSASDIDKWHRQRGFDCIGYHYVVRLDGSLQVGRPLDKVGAHCKGHNAHSIGIVYVGGIDENGQYADTRTAEQRGTMAVLISFLVRSFSTIKTISGHRDYAARACPCFDARKEYKAYLK